MHTATRIRKLEPMRQPAGGRKAGSDGTRNTNTHAHAQDVKAHTQTNKAKPSAQQRHTAQDSKRGRAQQNKAKQKQQNSGRRQRLHRDLVGAGSGDEKRLVI